MHRLNISYKQFYVTLNEIWLFESDPNAPSTWSERGGKQWQRSIRGRRNWDVELCPCAVIRHLCSVAFVWETKRPQADNSRSLIDRQVSCFIIIPAWLVFQWLTLTHWPLGDFVVIFTRGQLWPSGIVIACVCLCVRQSSVCPDDNLSPAQATITKIGPEVQNTLVKIPIIFGVHWPWPSRSNWT